MVEENYGINNEFPKNTGMIDPNHLNYLNINVCYQPSRHLPGQS